MNKRVQRLLFFLVVWLTMFSCISAVGQNSFKKPVKADFFNLTYPGGTAVEKAPDPSNSSKNRSIYPATPAFPGLDFLSDPIQNSGVPIYGLPANLYYIQSGFFCKREWEFEKVTRIPLRFRLGSLADCNAMEGKH